MIVGFLKNLKFLPHFAGWLADHVEKLFCAWYGEKLFLHLPLFPAKTHYSDSYYPKTKCAKRSKTEHKLLATNKCSSFNSLTFQNFQLDIFYVTTKIAKLSKIEITLLSKSEIFGWFSSWKIIHDWSWQVPFNTWQLCGPS